YKIAAEPLAALITEADTLGASTQLPPNLILAIMAVESGFNPYAMGTKGAMGLMQIVPSQLKASLSNFGGELATYDPLTNMRLGTRQLQSLVHDNGSLEVGILRYGEQSGQPDLKNYLQRVVSEYLQLEKVARQDPVPELLGIAPQTS
ncbi:MAG: Membrane-bound lytic murein transglycosylase, partial [Pseudomonadota bacterium]